MKNISKQTAAEIAALMVIMDAIEKGMPVEKAIEFVKSETFANAVKAYMQQIEKEF